jgi:hypothetical protein
LLKALFSAFIVVTQVSAVPSMTRNDVYKFGGSVVIFSQVIFLSWTALRLPESQADINTSSFRAIITAISLSGIAAFRSPAFPRSSANCGSDPFSRRHSKDFGLSRSSVAGSTIGSCAALTGEPNWGTERLQG